MTIEKNILLQLAIEGLKTQIKDKEEAIKHGQNILQDFELHNYKSSMTTLRYEEIKEKIYYLKGELDNIHQYKEELVYSIECEDLEII